MADKIIEIRFLVPPVLALVFACLSSSDASRTMLSSFDNLPELLAQLSLATLALGFIISSVVDCVLNWGGFKLSPANELALWGAMGRESEYLQGQVHKRWNIAIANFNAAGGIIAGIALPFMLQFGTADSRFLLWFGVSILLTGIFIDNGVRSYSSTEEFRKKLTSPMPG